MSKEKIALVTGCSTGIGNITSLTLARNGFYTYATMRNLDKSSNIKEISSKESLPLEVLQLDVTNNESVKNATEVLKAEKNRIDVLVNNAGYGLIGSIEEISIKELKEQFETNLFGMVRMIQSALPLMRNQKEDSSKIINLSSIGGILGYPLSAAYSSTKFAVEGLIESMVYELEQFGIKTILIEPAFVIDTNFHNNVKVPEKIASRSYSSPYKEFTQKLFENYGNVQNEYQTKAEDVAKIILEAAISDNPKQRYQVGKYSEMMVKTKYTCSDSECKNIMQKQFFSQ
ncbi:MAG TPA: SDR family oxidoreductase [Nitrososphaeraceae archaeon]|nr:SDR family oxidoreductase [Nitrososphaeraceae archaeon]